MMPTMNELLGSFAIPVTKPRNLTLDALFYDIGRLTSAEQRQLSNASDLEGGVIVVSPAKMGKAIRHYATAREMMKAERNDIAAIAVPGVGSSILGTAALARHVADTYGIEVAGIICGYGASDLFSEALGGWFFYGYTDRLRHEVETTLERVASILPKASIDGADGSFNASMAISDDVIPRQLDSGTLLAILIAGPPKLKLLVGHSKGALMIDYVLNKFVYALAQKPHRYYDNLSVVTVGAVIGIPKQFKRTRQIIGLLDWFGGINSLPDLLRSQEEAVRPKFIENAWHHLNPEYRYCLPLQQALMDHVLLA